MTDQISHRMPESIQRVAKGEYEVKGTALRIVQGDDGKWTITGHSDDLGAFGSRGAALGKLQELGLVPAVEQQPEEAAEAQQQPEQPQGEGRKEQPKRHPRTRKAEKAGATA
jgi:hypothetical protein